MPQQIKPTCVWKLLENRYGPNSDIPFYLDNYNWYSDEITIWHDLEDGYDFVLKPISKWTKKQCKSILE